MDRSIRSPRPSARRPPPRPRDISGVPFDLVSYDDVLNTIENWRRTGTRQYVALTPPYSVVLSRRDPELSRATRQAGLVLPDGVGIILAARILGYENRGRITGPLLMLRLCDWGRRQGYRHYFYGGAPGVAEALGRRLSQRYPGLQVAGTYCPPFRQLSPEEDQRVIEGINAADADLVWVGLGSPKQEKWMSEHVGRIKATALIGVGAAFDFHSGWVRWVPAAIRRAGLEWAHRLTLEPKRMWPWSLESPRFLLRVVRQRLGRCRWASRFYTCRTHTWEDRRRTRCSVARPAPVQNAFSVDVEEWFHILNAPAAPQCQVWAALESRVDRNMDRILELLHEHGIRATFFWLGWVAERHKSLLTRCFDAGHEIASHGYDHVVPRNVGPARFKHDLERAKKTLEDAVSAPVLGFRVAGFEIEEETKWAFDVIREAGYEYDSSVFPARYDNGGPHRSPRTPYLIQTRAGPLVEVPMSAVDVLGRQVCVFGGGYLRLAPRRLIQWGVTRLHTAGSPLIVYTHPREIDVDQPRMPLTGIRRFKYYVNLKTTLPKLRWLCRTYPFVPIHELVSGAGLLSQSWDRRPSAAMPR